MINTQTIAKSNSVSDCLGKGRNGGVGRECDDGEG
jgi:hypothetical protein